MQVSVASYPLIDVKLNAFYFNFAVGNYAHQVVWKCLVDDPDLFFRTVYEKITKSDRQVSLLLFQFVTLINLFLQPNALLKPMIL